MGAPSAVSSVAGGVAGVMTLLVLFPFSGVDTLPPKHYSVLGTRVPFGSPLLALALAIVVAVLVGVAASRWARRPR